MLRFLQASLFVPIIAGLLAGGAAVFGWQTAGTHALEESAPPRSSPSVSVDSIARRHMDAKPIPGLSVAVVQDGRIATQSTYGVADLASMRAATDSTIYQLASLTKAVTGIGLMMLVEEGHVALDDSIHTHLPDLPEAWHGITVRQTISHTSGLPPILDENGDPRGGGTVDAAWAQVQQQPLTATPGAAWSYTQTGGEVIRRLAEAVTGQSWEAFVQKHIIEPTGMQRTFFLYQPPPDSARVATGYDLEEGSLIAHDWVETYDYYIPTAMGLSSTTGDLARLSIALAEGRLINQASRAAMWTPTAHESGGFGTWDGTSSGYGVGWIMDTGHEHRRVWHSGGGMTTLHHYPDDGLTVIVLTNLSGAAPNAIAHDIAGVFL